MGEYAEYRGQRIKIGTCEDMYYLRADQRDQVKPLQGNVRPGSSEDQKVIRFRFPWPDEDNIKPGAFDEYKRSIAVPNANDRGIRSPESVDHYSVQFSADAGYLLSLPCPESGKARALLGDIQIHRNGFAGSVHVVQQGFRGEARHLAVILKCGGCGARWNLPTLEDAEPVIVAFRSEADRMANHSHSANDARIGWYHAIADRIAAGYTTAGVLTRA